MANFKVDYIVPIPEEEESCLIQLLIDFLFFGLFFVTPILISTRFKHIFNAPKHLWVGLIAVLMTVIWLMTSLIRRSIVLPTHRTFFFFALLIIWELLTIYRSPGMDLSLREYAAQLALFAICIVAASNVRSRTRIDNLVHYSIAAAVIAAGYALLQYYRLDVMVFSSLKNSLFDLSWLILPKKAEAQQKIYSFMGHRNYLAGYLICVLPILVSRLISSLSIMARSKRYSGFAQRQSIIYGLSTILLFTVVVLTQTRGSWIGLFAGLFLFFSILLYKFHSLSIFRPAVATAITMVTAALVFGSKSLTIPMIIGLAFLGGGMTLLCLFWQGKKSVTYLVVLLVLAAIIAASTSLVSKGKNPLARMRVSALDRLSRSFDLRQGSAFQRALIWITAVHIIMDNPKNFFFGTGFGTFGLYYMPFQAKVLAKPEYAHFTRMVNKSIYAHSEYLHFWSEIGLIGILLMLAAAYCFYSTVLSYLRSCEANYQNLLLLGMVSATAAVLVHNIFSFSLHLPYTSSLFYCLTAFSLCYQGTPALRLSWGDGQLRETALAHSNGWLGLSVRKLKEGLGRAWAGWLIEPSGEKPDDLYLVASGKGQKKISEKLPQTPWAQCVINLKKEKGKHKSWNVSLVSRGGGETKLAQLSLSAKKTIADPLSVLFTWTSVLLVAVGGAFVISLLGASYRVESHYRDANMLFRAKRFEESIIRYKEALLGAPNHGSILFDYGRALMDSGRNMAAVKVFEKSVANFIDPATIFNIGLCYFKEGKRKESLEQQFKALELNPIYKQSLVKIANELMQTNKLKEAAPFVEKAMKYYGNDPHVLTTAGVFAMHEKRYTEARAILEEALKIDPNFGPARLNLAAQLLHDKEYDRAEKLFESLVRAKRNNPTFVVGYLEARLGRFKEQHKKDPDNMELVKALGMTYAHVAKFKHNHLQDASKYLRRYLAHNKEDAEARYYLGGALLMGNYLDMAIEELEAARSLVDDSSPMSKEIDRTLATARSRRRSYRTTGP